MAAVAATSSDTRFAEMADECSRPRQCRSAFVRPLLAVWRHGSLPCSRSKNYRSLSAEVLGEVRD